MLVKLTNISLIGLDLGLLLLLFRVNWFAGLVVVATFIVIGLLSIPLIAWLSEWVSEGS